jgi:hypothetical protein
VGSSGAAGGGHRKLALSLVILATILAVVAIFSIQATARR